MTSKKILKYLVYTVVIGNLALFAWVFMGAATSKKPAPVSLPKPNGQDPATGTNLALPAASGPRGG